MKKFLALLLALAMTLALVACGEKKDDTKTDGAGDGEKTYKVAMICRLQHQRRRLGRCLLQRYGQGC